MPSAETTEQSELEKILGHDFAKPELLSQALTHSSLAGSAKRAGEALSYERLEFLGDRVLGLIVADLLLERFPNESEGALAKRHAALVRKEALAVVAQNLGLGRFLRLSRSEQEAGGQKNPGLLADVCEALIGALYLDGGLAVAQAFVLGNWQSLVAADRSPPQDSKTGLQEWAQGRGLALPLYREISREGPAHDPRFVVEVSVAGEAPARGRGRSKRLAEQEAASQLLARLKKKG